MSLAGHKNSLKIVLGCVGILILIAFWLFISDCVKLSSRYNIKKVCVNIAQDSANTWEWYHGKGTAWVAEGKRTVGAKVNHAQAFGLEGDKKIWLSSNGEYVYEARCELEVIDSNRIYTAEEYNRLQVGRH